ncbi:hypothetical protein H4582DRAFT_1521895 [Lactarius indigo]|nr:hypothetical protein H4582DRAFT_1521895 [Lactarius indigo]
MAQFRAQDLAQWLCHHSSYNSPCQHQWRSVEAEYVAKCEQVKSYFWTARESSRSPKHSRALQLFTTADLVYLTHPHLSLTSGTHNPTTEASVIIVNHLPTSVTFIAPSFPFVAWILAPSNDTTLTPLAFITSASFVQILHSRGMAASSPFRTPQRPRSHP